MMLRTPADFLYALRTIPRIGVFRYLLAPALLTGLLFLGVWKLTGILVDPLEDYLISLYPWEIGEGALAWTSDWLSSGLFLMIFLFGFKYLLLIVAGPFLSHLSEKIQELHEPGRRAPSLSLGSLLRDFLRGLRFNIRSMIKESVFTLILLPSSVIPGVALLTTPLLFCIQSYYAGLGQWDITLERHLGARASVRYGRAHLLEVMLHGAIFISLLSIPILGWLLSPPLSTAAAARAIYRRGAPSRDGEL